MVKGIIIEGLAGTGKSTLLQGLVNNDRFKRQYPQTAVWDEDLTLGELVAELRNEPMPDKDRCKRLELLFPAIEKAAGQNKFIVLERFHHSYFALMPDWELYAAMDMELRHIGIATVMLDIPESLIEERCFNRPEGGEGFKENILSWYGDRQKALSAFSTLQKNRLEALQLSCLPSVVIDTSLKEWNNYIGKVMELYLGD